jgi:hypothetical protein
MTKATKLAILIDGVTVAESRAQFECPVAAEPPPLVL